MLALSRHCNPVRSRKRCDGLMDAGYLGVPHKLNQPYYCKAGNWNISCIVSFIINEPQTHASWLTCCYTLRRRGLPCAALCLQLLCDIGILREKLTECCLPYSSHTKARHAYMLACTLKLTLIECHGGCMALWQHEPACRPCNHAAMQPFMMTRSRSTTLRCTAPSNHDTHSSVWRVDPMIFKSPNFNLASKYNCWGWHIVRSIYYCWKAGSLQTHARPRIVRPPYRDSLGVVT